MTHEYIIKVDDEKRDIMGGMPLEEQPKELVRCKDCYYFIPPKDRDIRSLYSCRELWSKYAIGENDFCSKAIRRDDVYRRRKKDGGQE